MLVILGIATLAKDAYKYLCRSLNPHLLLDECAVSDPLLHLRFFYQFSRLVHIDGWRFDTLHILENQDMGGWVASLAM